MKQSLLLLVVALALAGCGARGSSTAPGAARFDLSTRHGRAVLAGFDPRYLVVGASPQTIPAIARPRFDSPAVASRLLRPTDFVIGVQVEGDAARTRSSCSRCTRW
jgi:hypothetical protein